MDGISGFYGIGILSFFFFFKKILLSLKDLFCNIQIIL